MFMAAVITIRTMATAHWPGFDSGGMLWFPDLTAAAWAGSIGEQLIGTLHLSARCKWR